MTRGPAAFLLVLLVACDPGEVSLTDPSGTIGTGARLDLQVVLGEDVPGPAAWAAGVPDAKVYYARTGTRGFVWGTARTDSSGSVSLTGLEPGLYWIAAEASTSGQIYAAGEKVRVQAEPLTATAPLQAPRRDGIVVSEVYFSEPPPWIVETDGESKYVELFNNSDRVIHLDGMLLGHVYHWHYEVPMFEHHYCRDTQPLRNDPEGVWASAIWRFPGSGVDYPVSPGEVVLIAVLAGDHRGRHESFLDLSHADFEFLLPGFADNPAVPNMQVVGTRPQRAQDFVGDALLVVAEPQNVTGYPRVPDPGATNYIEEYVRIPTATIHDLSYLMWDRYGAYSTLPPFPFCDEPVNPRFDRIPGGFRTDQGDTYRSMQRRVSSPGVLLDTNVSRIDFVMGPRTPGTIQ